jgi:hypothetical protein
MTIATELAMPGRPLCHLDERTKQLTAFSFGPETLL